MPELPEVETIRLQLQRFLIGHEIKDVELKFGKKFEGNKEKLLGGKIVDVRRFGKIQSIDLSNNYSILIHIKMTGQLIYLGPNQNKLALSKKITGGVPGKHTHIIFHLDKNGNLYFNDVRKFGWVKVVKTNEVEKNDFIAHLGPEPAVAKNSVVKTVLTFEYFSEMLLKTSRQIKTVIMDQTKIGGVGNIYANDALWLAKINPKRPGKSLNIQEKKSLFDAIHKVLREGIKYGGSSENSYVTPDGAEGSYQNHSLVYGHTGEICQRCGKAKIQKYFLGGRGTYVCTICQTV